MRPEKSGLFFYTEIFAVLCYNNKQRKSYLFKLLSKEGSAV